MLRVARASLLLTLPACTVWTRPEPGERLASPSLGSTVRLYLRDGTNVEMTDVHVEDDSVIGARRDGSHQRVAVARASVDSVATRRVSAARTTALVAGISIAAIAAALIYAVQHVDPIKRIYVPIT